jgi:hypothetical protein
MMALLHTCATPCWSLMAGRGSSGETLGGQQGTPALTRPHRRDGLRVLLMAVWCPFRRPSMGRQVPHAFMRNALLDLTTILPATPYHQRNYVEAYSRYKAHQAYLASKPIPMIQREMESSTREV